MALPSTRMALPSRGRVGLGRENKLCHGATRPWGNPAMGQPGHGPTRPWRVRADERWAHLSVCRAWADASAGQRHTNRRPPPRARYGPDAPCSLRPPPCPAIARHCALRPGPQSPPPLVLRPWAWGLPPMAADREPLQEFPEPCPTPQGPAWPRGLPVCSLVVHRCPRNHH